MDTNALRALQQPLKDAYRADPAQALVTLRAEGELGAETISCSVATGRALAEAGLHPASGGDRKSTRLNSSHVQPSRMPSSA